MRPTSAFFALAIAALTLPASVLAAVPPPDIGGLAAPAGAGLVVVEERARVECGPMRSCRFETTYVVQNRTLAPIETEVRGPVIARQVVIDGQPSTHESLSAMRFEPGQRRTLVFAGTTNAVTFMSFFPTFDALFARHVLLSSPWEVAHASFAIDPPAPPLADEARLEVELVVPAEWSITPGEGWEERAEGARRIGRYVARAAGDTTWANVRAERFVLEPRFGGVIAGIGGTFNANVRARLGVEVGFGEFLLTSIVMETDFQRHLTLAWVVELALPALLVIPSIDVGVGIPVRVWNEGGNALAGLRLQAGAMFYAIGLVSTFDYFPTGDVWEASLLFQVSL
ncbi:MAG: hypothetical protein IT378_05920 [Sandaracinaceae bacterium]|nr:hypothetical protein [Sandaracinaceae bacterium]